MAKRLGSKIYLIFCPKIVLKTLIQNAFQNLIPNLAQNFFLKFQSKPNTKFCPNSEHKIWLKFWLKNLASKFRQKLCIKFWPENMAKNLAQIS